MSIVNIDPVSGREILLMDAFSYNGQYNVKATGFLGSADGKGGITNVDFAIGAEDRYLQGIRLLLKNHLWGDVVDLQIVDKDSLVPADQRAAFPTWPILNQFAFNWSVDSEKQDQGQQVFTYVARIPAGMYIRMIYNSSGTILTPDVQIKLNCLLHKKVA